MAQRCCHIAISLALIGCTSLLPVAHQESPTPWASYDDAQAMFVKILPGKTTHHQLSELGVDPIRTPNIVVLGHADLLRRLIPASLADVRWLDPGLQACVAAPQSCFGYEIEQTHVDRQRFGNFWLDFFNFKRRVNVSGWQFNAVVVIKDNVVIYKLWSGKPNIHQLEQENSPLGPLQGLGPSLFSH